MNLSRRNFLKLLSVMLPTTVLPQEQPLEQKAVETNKVSTDKISNEPPAKTIGTSVWHTDSSGSAWSSTWYPTAASCTAIVTPCSMYFRSYSQVEYLYPTAISVKPLTPEQRKAQRKRELLERYDQLGMRYSKFAEWDKATHVDKV